MKKNYIIILLVALFALPDLVFAQERKITRRRIEIGQEPDKNERSNNDALRYALTLEPTKIISGEVPLTLQLAPTDWVVFEAGMGLTWNNYFMQLLEEFNPSVPFETENEKVNINPSYVVGVKFFPEMDVFYDEYYLGLQFTHREYSQSYDYEGTEYESGKRYRDISLLYGAHTSTGVDWIYFDSYTGIGIRLVDEFGMREDYSVVSQEYTYMPYEENRNTIGFVMGIKVGFLLDNF